MHGRGLARVSTLAQGGHRDLALMAAQHNVSNRNRAAGLADAVVDPAHG